MQRYASVAKCEFRKNRWKGSRAFFFMDVDKIACVVKLCDVFTVKND